MEAESEFEKLLGGSHVKSAMAELSKLDRGDETDTIKLSELLYGRHFRGRCIVMYSSGISPFVSICLSKCCTMVPSTAGATASQSFLFSPKLLFVFTHSFCSCLYWINPICFTTAIRHKCCVLFLLNCI